MAGEDWPDQPPGLVNGRAPTPDITFEELFAALFGGGQQAAPAPDVRTVAQSMLSERGAPMTEQNLQAAIPMARERMAMEATTNAQQQAPGSSPIPQGRPVDAMQGQPNAAPPVDGPAITPAPGTDAGGGGQDTGGPGSAPQGGGIDPLTGLPLLLAGARVMQEPAREAVPQIEGPGRVPQIAGPPRQLGAPPPQIEGPRAQIAAQPPEADQGQAAQGQRGDRARRRNATPPAAADVSATPRAAPPVDPATAPIDVMEPDAPSNAGGDAVDGGRAIDLTDMPEGTRIVNTSPTQMEGTFVSADRGDGRDIPGNALINTKTTEMIIPTNDGRYMIIPAGSSHESIRRAVLAAAGRAIRGAL